LFWLSLNVIKARQKNQIIYGDGGIDELMIARSAQSNAAEYIPVILLLMMLLEYNGGHVLLIHAAGIVCVAGRILHGRSILSQQLKGRIIGMHMTFWPIVALAAFNILYVPYSQFL